MKRNITAQEYRAAQEINNAQRLTSDITEKQIEGFANLLREYDDASVKYMLFAVQTCVALANVPENMEAMKGTAIEFVRDLYLAIDGAKT